MTPSKLTLVPIVALSVNQLRARYDPMRNPWCEHCSCPTGKQPCQKDKSPFTWGEITDAIIRQDYEPVRNELWGYDNTRNGHGKKNEDLCNRARHVRRIAYLAVNCDGKDPHQDEREDGRN